jgi:hypothetical protein
MFKALRPGGELWFAENLAGSALHRLARRFIRRGGLWRYPTVAEIEQLLAPFSSVRRTTAGFLGVFGRDGRLRDALGTFDRLLCNRLLPDAWKYVVIVCARKGDARPADEAERTHAHTSPATVKTGASDRSQSSTQLRCVA